MAMLAVKFKIMPESPEAKLDKILEQAKKEIENGKGIFHSSEQEPIAFGLVAIIVTVAWPEQNDLDALEAALGKIPEVQSVQIIDFRRAFG
jgi:elongation factor 1-beta